MNSKRVVFLMLAVIVAGATAFMARACAAERARRLDGAGRPSSRSSVVAPTLQVLVARNAIHTGQIVKPDDMRWQLLAAGQPGADLHRRRQAPAVGLRWWPWHVARSRPASRSPKASSCWPATRGFMAAVLQPGTRAVSVPITATSAVSASSMPEIASMSC